MVGELIAGRYELEELVGSGGMSSVFRAHDTLLERRVALKLLHEHYGGDDEYVERFRREARAVAQLSHPNIVTVIDRGEDDGRQFIVFEYVSGENLKAMVDRKGPLPVRQALELAIEIARGLAFAHAQGLIHRDVKPGNILLDENGKAYITDFGLMKDREASVLTRPGQALGSMDYMAPEQIRGEEVTAQSDVYALGCVMIECLSGQPPFADRQGMRILWAHLQEDPPDPSAGRDDVPPDVGWAITRALEKEPEKRPPTATAYAHMVRIAALGMN